MLYTNIIFQATFSYFIWNKVDENIKRDYNKKNDLNIDIHKFVLIKSSILL